MIQFFFALSEVHYMVFLVWIYVQSEFWILERIVIMMLRGFFQFLIFFCLKFCNVYDTSFIRRGLPDIYIMLLHDCNGIFRKYVVIFWHSNLITTKTAKKIQIFNGGQTWKTIDRFQIHKTIWRRRRRRWRLRFWRLFYRSWPFRPQQGHVPEVWTKLSVKPENLRDRWDQNLDQSIPKTK